MAIAEKWETCIKGEPASKSNARRMVRGKNGRTIIIKSKKALDYVKMFEAECPVREPLFEVDLTVYMEIYYGSRRPDLDESLILDCLQGKAYKNDRQVKRKEIIWGLDRDNPRTIIRITPLEGGNRTGDKGHIHSRKRSRKKSKGSGGVVNK